MRTRTGLMLIAPLDLVLAGFFVVPMLMMLPTSFREYAPGLGVTPGVWTLENYTRIVTDDYYLEVIGRTLGLGLFVTLACLLLGYPLAYLIARGPQRWRAPLILLVFSPLMLTLVVLSSPCCPAWGSACRSCSSPPGSAGR